MELMSLQSPEENKAISSYLQSRGTERIVIYLENSINIYVDLDSASILMTSSGKDCFTLTNNVVEKTSCDAKHQFMCEAKSSSNTGSSADAYNGGVTVEVTTNSIK
jgi:hypothetical protein